MPVNTQSFVPVVLALQFVVFGWRISREIALSDEERRTWLLVSDYLVLLSMLTVLIFCIIAPIATGIFSAVSEVCVVVAFVIVIFYPIVLAGHYRLFSKKGRSIYSERDQDVAYITDQEGVLLAVTVLAAAAAGFWVAVY